MKYILFFLILTCKTCFGQLTIGYFPWQNMLGLTKGLPKQFAVDYKLETNSFLNNMNMELSLRRYHSVIMKIDHVDYLEIINKSTFNYGLGIAFNPTNFQKNIKTINGYYLDLGIRWSIPKREYLAIVLECSPYVNQSFTNGNLRTRLGLTYKLTK